MNCNFGDKLIYTQNRQCIFVRDNNGKAVVLLPDSEQVVSVSYSSLANDEKTFDCIELPRKAGKTTKALKKVADNITRNIPTIFISVESNTQQIQEQLLFVMSNIDYYEAIQKQSLTFEQIDLLLDNQIKLQNSKFSSYYKPYITNDKIEEVCKLMLMSNDNVCLVFDYCRNDDQLRFLKNRIHRDLGVSVYAFKQKPRGQRCTLNTREDFSEIHY